MDRRNGTGRVVYHTHSAEETFELAKTFVKQLTAPSVICFFGDLGSGKTTFIKGIAEGLAISSDISVNSPTFQYLNIYSGKTTLYHFDLYRLRSSDDFILLGFDEFFDQGIVCIEWAEKIDEILPKKTIQIHLCYEGDGRKIEIYTNSALFPLR